jgi:hypothetical protein
MAADARYIGSERRVATASAWMVGLAALGITGVVFATLCPIGLRPHLAAPNAERFGAYVVLGAVLALAAGRRAAGATALVVLLAFGLEAAQALAPGRDPAVSDALVKALGGMVGSGMGQVMFPVRRLIARAAGAMALRAG